MTLDQTAYISRAAELEYILDCVSDAESCAIVGLSNMGKSILLRSIKQAATIGLLKAQVQEYVFIYIDFNLMVEMTEQAFYELILRSACTTLSSASCENSTSEHLQESYHKVVDSSNPFLIPLGFNEGIMTMCEELGNRVVLLFDEFDEPFAKIDERVFLNLRALKDRYNRQLCYVVATGKRLGSMRRGSAIGEFCEMFAHQTLYLGPLSQKDTRQATKEFFAREGLTPTERDIGFVWNVTGGHPGLVDAVCHILATTGGEESDPEYDLVREKLDSDPSIRNECVKLWNGLESDYQDALVDLASGKEIEPPHLVPLLNHGILRQNETIEFFGTLFSGFVRRQRLIKSPYLPGVRVDVDSGEVWVDGKHTPTLTELEYRLLLLFYGRMGKICDKYQIVEAVWGEDYIDQVDDARIEKLISRLRKKIETTPQDPQHLQTVRGRGYRLVEG